MKDATAEIAAGLAAGTISNRNRRRESIGALYRRSPELDEMRRQFRSNPDRFEATYGPRGRLVLGFYDQARRALATEDPEESP